MAASPRRVAMEELKRLWKERRNGAYFVKRGVINWATFPFEQYKRGVAIMIDESSLLLDEGRYEVELGIEVMARMPAAPTDPQEAAKFVPEIDDALLDELFEDVERVLAEFKKKRDPNDESYPVAYKVNTQGARVVEMHDADMGVQGLIVNLTIGY